MTRELVKISRPSFWLYVFGPFVIGLLAAPAGHLLDWRTALFAFYFLLPANLTLYGINDIYDYAVDKLNRRQVGADSLIAPSRRNYLWITIALFNLPVVVAFPLVPLYARVSLAAFLFFGIFYSASPIRAKARPFFDSAFNILFVFPGLVGFYLGGVSALNSPALWAACLWFIALHAFRSVPDIESDRGTDLRTIATVMGKQGTLIFCLILFLIITYLAFRLLGATGLILGTLYIYLTLRALSGRSREDLSRLARIMHWTNNAVVLAVIVTLALG